MQQSKAKPRRPLTPTVAPNPRAPFASAPPTPPPPSPPSPPPTAISIAVPRPPCRYNSTASKAGLWSDVHSLQSPSPSHPSFCEVTYTHAHSTESLPQEPSHVQSVSVRKKRSSITRQVSHHTPVIFEAVAGRTSWTSLRHLGRPILHHPRLLETAGRYHRHSSRRSAHLPLRAATPGVAGPEEAISFHGRQYGTSN